MFQDLVADYDKDVQIQCQAIHDAIKEIDAKQELMRENFGHMIDQVLANVGGDENDGDGADEASPVDQDNNTPGNHWFFYLCTCIHLSYFYRTDEHMFLRHFCVCLYTCIPIFFAVTKCVFYNILLICSFIFPTKNIRPKCRHGSVQQGETNRGQGIGV
jgi:hypothetical protein